MGFACGTQERQPFRATRLVFVPVMTKKYMTGFKIAKILGLFSVLLGAWFRCTHSGESKNFMRPMGYKTLFKVLNMTFPSSITDSASSSAWTTPQALPADFRLLKPPKQIACSGISSDRRFQTLDFLLQDAQSYWPEKIVYPQGGERVKTPVPQPEGLAVIVSEGGGGNRIAEGGKIRGVDSRYDATAQKWITQYDADRKTDPKLLKNLKAGVEVIRSNASLSQQRLDYADVRVTTGQLLYDANKNVYVFAYTKEGAILYGQIVNGKLVPSRSEKFVPLDIAGSRGSCGSDPILRDLP